MLASNVPVKFPIPFASSAGGSYTHQVPTTSQIGIIGGAASLTDGFPPLCFTPTSGGGIPPLGIDFNGLFNQITSWVQWFGAGAPMVYDAAYSTAIGGYPKNAIISSATTLGLRWLSVVDSNASNPDTGGAGWVMASPATSQYVVDTSITANQITIAPTQPLISYANAVGQIYFVNIANANTGAVSIAVSGLANQSVVSLDGAVLRAGATSPGYVMILQYTGGGFQWLNAPVGITQPVNDNSNFEATTGYADRSAANALTAANAYANGLLAGVGAVGPFIWSVQGL